MQEKSKSWSPAETAIATGKLDMDYWTIAPATIQDYSVKISCGDSDSAVSAVKTKVYNDYAANIDGLQNALEYLTTAVASSNTATLKART